MSALREPVAAVTVIAAALLDLLAVPNPSGGLPVPWLLSGALFFWTMARPDLLAPWFLAALGIAVDATAGLTPGPTAVGLLAGRRAILAMRRRLLLLPPVALWVGFLLAALVILCVRWSLASLAVGYPLPSRPPLLELGLSVAAYPLVTALIRPLQSRFSAKHRASRA